jgi:carbonic anhydrase
MPKHADIAMPDAKHALSKTESEIPEIRIVVPSKRKVSPSHLDEYKNKYCNCCPYNEQSPLDVGNYRDQKKRANKVS